MRNLRIAVLVGAVVSTSIAGSASAAPAAPAVVTAPLKMLCSATAEWCRLLAKKYEESFHVPVEMKQLATNSALEEIRKSRGAGNFDVWYGGTGEPHLEAGSENLTVSYQSSRLKELHDWAQRQATMSNYRTVGVYSGMLGFIVNEEKLKQKGIKVPRCWVNLLRPEYADLIAAPYPPSSGTGYTMIATLVSMMGEDTAFQYMKRLSLSIHEYVKSGSQLAPKVASGEMPIAIGFIHDGVRERQKSAPIVTVSPCEGAGYETGSVSIVQGGDLKESKRFVDWVLSPDAQAYAAEAKQFQMPSNRRTPIPVGTPRFSDFKIYMAYDAKKFAEPAEKKRLMTRWENEVQPSERSRP